MGIGQESSENGESGAGGGWEVGAVVFKLYLFGYARS